MLNALVLASAGWAVAAGHGRARLAGGARGRPPRGRGTGHRLARVSHALVLGAAGLGVVLADVAFASVVGGLPLVAGWAG